MTEREPIILQDIRSLRKVVDERSAVPVTASKMAYELCRLGESIALKGEEDERFLKWLEHCREALCKICGDCVWTHDHCGHWGHMYCESCDKPKHPDLAHMGCGEISKQWASEAEYLASQGAADA